MPTDPALQEIGTVLKSCFRDDREELQKLLRLIKDLEQMNSKDALYLIGELKPMSRHFLRFTLSFFGLGLRLMEVERIALT